MGCPDRLENVYPQDIHSLTEKGLKKPALVYIFLSRGVGQDNLQGVIWPQLFCDPILKYSSIQLVYIYIWQGLFSLSTNSK